MGKEVKNQLKEGALLKEHKLLTNLLELVAILKNQIGRSAEIRRTDLIVFRMRLSLS